VQGQEPQNIDKEFLRLWFRANCDPYNDPVGGKASGRVGGLVAGQLWMSAVLEDAYECSASVHGITVPARGQAAGALLRAIPWKRVLAWRLRCA